MHYLDISGGRGGRWSSESVKKKFMLVGTRQYFNGHQKFEFKKPYS